MKINRLIKEEINKYIGAIICESQESKSQGKAKKLCMKHGMSDKEAEEFVRIDLRNDLTELRNSNTAKFTLGCARLFFERQLTDAKTIGLLNSILKLITERYYDKFDQNLNNLSLNDLSNQFTQELNNIEQQNRDDVYSKEYSNNGYSIVSIDSFEDAKKYYDYLYEKSPWCITYLNQMWNTYTKDGINQVYFCLKDGFENITPPEEDGNFKNEYGLSMISVIVDEDGRLAFSTTRWNHKNGANGGSDLTVQEISDIIGVNFYEIFKPNTNLKDMLNDAINRFKNGENPNDIFSYVGKLNDGFTRVIFNKKYNYINTNGETISEQWFDGGYDFNDGFAEVELNGKYNYININGEIISKQWFDYIKNFNDGLAIVHLNGKDNYINTNGETISEQWFDEVYDFNDGFAIVHLNGKDNYINTNGEIISKQWFDDISGFNYYGAAIVDLDNKCNLINKDGELLSDKWFDDCYWTNEGVVVELDGKYYIINTTNGNLYNIE